MPTRSGRARVIVVGAGVIGCAVAYLLARAGFGVTLIERDAIAAHASGHNAGNLNPLYRTPPSLVPFALDAFAFHRQVATELKQLGCADYAALPVRRVHLGCSEGDRAELEETAALFDATPGFSSDWLVRDDLVRVEPRLAPDFGFGVVTRGNLSVDSGDFTRSLADGAVRLGASILRGTVSGIVTAGDRVGGVQLAGTVVPCDAVVFATGPWVRDVATWLGIDLAVEPVKGELLSLRLPDGAPSHDLTWGSVALYRRRGDEVWVGGTTERCGFDAWVSAEAKESLLQGACRVLPALRHAMLLEHVAALRPMAPNEAPIIGRAEGWQNIYLANGGGAKGVLLSVGIAKSVRGLILVAEGDASSTEIEGRYAASLP